MVRLAMLSRWHLHAKLYAKQAKESGKAEIVAVWDELPERGRDWAAELGADFEENLDAILARADVDGVVIDTPTSMHAEVIMKAAKAGKHIFTEKAMTLTMKEAREVEKVVKESGVMFMISFVHRINGVYDVIKQTLEKGLLGDISKFRMHYSHSGASAGWLPEYWYDEATAGGGALMDLGCHHLYIARWLMGKPKRLFSMFNSLTGRQVEDNAEVQIEFANQAIGTISTSLVSYNSPSLVEIYGTKGSIFWLSGQNLRMITESVDLQMGTTGTWYEPPIPATHPIPIHQFINALDANDPSHIGYGMQEGIDLTELIEAAYISHKEKRMVYFD